MTKKVLFGIIFLLSLLLSKMATSPCVKGLYSLFQITETSVSQSIHLHSGVSILLVLLPIYGFGLFNFKIGRASRILLRTIELLLGICLLYLAVSLSILNARAGYIGAAAVLFAYLVLCMDIRFEKARKNRA